MKEAVCSECETLKRRIALVADDIAFFGFDGALVLNCGDTFAYVCADTEEVPDDQIDTVRRLHDKHGYTGLVAWIARRRGTEPLLQRRTEAYRAALADIDHTADMKDVGPREGVGVVSLFDRPLRPWYRPYWEPLAALALVCLPWAAFALLLWRL